MRRVDGRETWKRLIDWDKGSTASERLAATIVAADGYTAVNPSHPLGVISGHPQFYQLKTSINPSIFPKQNQKLDYGCPFYFSVKSNHDRNIVQKWQKQGGCAFIGFI